MKQPDNGLWRNLGLRNNYLPPLFAAVLLFSSFCVQAQSYTTLNGRFNYADSVKFSKLKNTFAKDSVLTTDSTGRILFKYISQSASTNEITGELIIGSSSPTIILANTPISNTIKLIKNGIRLPPFKYSVSGSTITLTDARVSTDVFESDYKF